MRTLIGRVVIALVLITTAFFARRQAAELGRDAETLERLATLRSDIADDASPSSRAVASYWSGAYERLTTTPEAAEREQDPRLMLLSANAAYRAAERATSTQPRSARVQQLDAVIQAYASALKAPLFMPDAAYNYEYVVRLREGIARARGNTVQPQAKAAATTPSVDLPIGPTIHGRPGGPPPETKGEEFEIITPMEYGDREAQPLPTSGAKPIRKG
jgi:hypothetical protein